VHFFRIILRHLSSTCFVAECDNQLAGWVFGFFSQNQADLFFLWQIGVKPNMQGKGLGKKLLNYCETHLKEKGCRKIELTVDPQNTPSCKLFEQMGYKNSSTQEVAVLANNQLAVKDFYGAGRHFVLFTKIL
jgi:L-2,4-diaminobutyric acid acetyltransferase